MIGFQDIIKGYKRRRDNQYLSQVYKKNYAFIGFGNHCIHNLYPIIQHLQVNVKYICCSSPQKAKLIPLKNEEFKPTGKFKVEFIEPEKAVAEGQAAVFYAGDYIIGGGIIESVERLGIL